MATPLSLSTAYLLCIACVLLDALARAQRLCILVRASGGTLPLTAALGANLVEDAGAGLTPMRVGGAPARLVILRRWGVDLATGVMITIVEVIVAYVPVLLTGAVLAYFFARNWWLDVGGGLRTSIGHFLPWLVLGVAFGALGWQAMRKLLPRHHRWARRTLARARRELRDAGPSAVFWSFILSLLSAGARLAILPLLTLTVSSPPPLGVALLASFFLLYGQVLLPMPSGLGAVELGFLAGATGVAGNSTAVLLLAWRVFTTLLPVIAGVIVASVESARGLWQKLFSPRRAGGAAARETEFRAS